MEVVIKINANIFSDVQEELIERSWFYAIEDNEYGYSYWYAIKWFKPWREYKETEIYEEMLEDSRQADSIRWLRCSGTEAIFNKENMTATFKGRRNSIAEFLQWFPSVDFTKCEVISMRSERMDVPWYTPVSKVVNSEDWYNFSLTLREKGGEYEVSLNHRDNVVWSEVYASKQEAYGVFNSITQHYYGGYPRRGETSLQKALCAVSECFRIHERGNETAEACNAAS